MPSQIPASVTWSRSGSPFPAGATNNLQVWVVDQSGGLDPSASLPDVVTALTIQANNEFHNAWQTPTITVTALPTGVNPSTKPAPDWLLFLVPNTGSDLGYHTVQIDTNGQEQTVGFVSAGSGYGGWSITASHELLEMLGDPLVNQCRDGIFQEVCDPVENSTYLAAGTNVYVSDFVNPTWFDANGAAPFDYKQRAGSPQSLGADGGYYLSCSGTGARGVSVGAFDPGVNVVPPSIFRNSHAQRGFSQFETALISADPVLRRIVRKWQASPRPNTAQGWGFSVLASKARSAPQTRGSIETTATPKRNKGRRS